MGYPYCCMGVQRPPHGLSDGGRAGSQGGCVSEFAPSPNTRGKFTQKWSIMHKVSSDNLISKMISRARAKIDYLMDGRNCSPKSRAKK